MSGYDTTNKLPAKAQNDTYFFLKELEKEIAALRAENERLKGELEHWTSGAKSLLEWLYNGKLPEIPRPEGE